jgi:transcriptional regulator with XRE-family HTH domain
MRSEVNMLTPVKLQRLQKGMRQIQLASRTGIARCRLSEIECGYVEARPEEMARIASVLNVPVELLAKKPDSGLVPSESPTGLGT